MHDPSEPGTPDTSPSRDTPSEAVVAIRQDERLGRDARSPRGGHRGAKGRDPSKSRRSGLYIVVPLVMFAAAIAGIVLTGLKDNAIYSKPVDELVAQKSKFAGRPVRAEGNLVHGTLAKRETPCEYRFTITKNGVDVPVRFAQCIVPDTFRDVPGTDVGVTVEGELHADNTFEATSVLAKCPSKYEMKDRNANGEAVPHGMAEGPRETM